MATIIDIEGFFPRGGIQMFDVWLNSIARLVVGGGSWLVFRTSWKTERSSRFDVKKEREHSLLYPSFSKLDGS